MPPAACAAVAASSSTITTTPTSTPSHHARQGRRRARRSRRSVGFRIARCWSVIGCPRFGVRCCCSGLLVVPVFWVLFLFGSLVLLVGVCLLLRWLPPLRPSALPLLLCPDEGVGPARGPGF